MPLFPGQMSVFVCLVDIRQERRQEDKNTCDDHQQLEFGISKNKVIEAVYEYQQVSQKNRYQKKSISLGFSNYKKYDGQTC
jgi:hypothetical protein